jgi:hypothetical protein
MEDLTMTVYECSLPVEAHMICDLLARAGVSARVDGEFLAGAGGELPLGNTIKVRVDPSRAAEAREVIDEWQRLSPPPDGVPRTIIRSPWRSPLWFMFGAVIGGGIMLLALRTPVSADTGDTNGDGIVDETYVYNGAVVSRIDYDRNADRKVDARWLYDINGNAVRYESDDDFDGDFEWSNEVEANSIMDRVLDTNGDGKPERVEHHRHNILRSEDVYAEDGHVIVRNHYDAWRLISREYDKDGDGTFERRVEFDALGDPLSPAP